MEDSDDLASLLNDMLLHRPESSGVRPDAAGWTPLEALIETLVGNHKSVDRPQIETLVETDARRRFEISADGTKIRALAAAGRSDQMPGSPLEPPAHLYYPTSTRFLGAVHTGGLRSSSRRFLHLFDDLETASSLAPALADRVIITVMATSMQERGHLFWRNENGVWLTESVPPEFLL